MAYIKTSWVARVGTALNRFLKTNEDSPSGTVELTNDPTGVTTAGTPFTVANMNKIEQGVYDAHVTADNHIANTSNPHAVTKEQVTGLKTTDSPTFASINTGSGAMTFDQGVRTTDNVGFANINPPVDNNDASMPSVGIGGFSYAVGSTSQADTFPSITIGSGGTWVYIAFSTRSASDFQTRVGRIAGGSSVQGMVQSGSGVTAYVYVIAWRIS